MSANSAQDEKFTQDEVNGFAKQLDTWSKGITPAERALLILLISSSHAATNRPEDIDTEKALKSIENVTRNAVQRFVNETKQELANA